MKGLPALLSLFGKAPPEVGITPAEVVHAENKWRLLRYLRPEGAPARWRTPLLLVPSLINRHTVLDLRPGKSFAEYMVQRGHDVFCIDWGTPGDEDRDLSLDEVWDGYLGRAVRRSARAAGGEQVHLLGYCMGGTMTAAYAAARPERVASLTTLAAPIRFGEGDEGGGMLASWSRTPTFDPAALLAAFGNVPWPLMQAAFHLLRPTLTLSKAVHLLDRAWDDESLDGFLALERWGADNVAFPGACWKRYIEELYRADALARGTFRLAGHPAKLEAITCPTLCVTFEHDTIVPWRGAKELVDRVGATDKQWLHLKGGHVGAVVSRAASKGLWPTISEFLAQRDGREPAAPKEPPRRSRDRRSTRPAG